MTADHMHADDAPMDFDEILRQEDRERDAAARREAWHRALWAEADIAFRTDAGYAIAIAKAATAAVNRTRARL